MAACFKRVGGVYTPRTKEAKSKYWFDAWSAVEPCLGVLECELLRGKRGEMTPARLEQIKEIFYAAVEQSPERRCEFLAEACAGDEGLRREVERLLAEHDRAGGFLDSPFGSVVSIRYLAQNERTLEPNQMIAGRYRIVNLLGEGGMGVVYKAEDTRLPRFVALKSLGRAVSKDAASLERLRREARAASALNHPNICTIYDVVESEGQTFIVMEYLDGQTLKEMIKAGQFSGQDTQTERKAALFHLDNAVRIATQIVEGLNAAHDKGIVHRDIKPANIFVTKAGLVKILDFGIAKMARARDSFAASADVAQSALISGRDLTSTGVAAGTVGYMSPEQITSKELDSRTDLFSFGAVLYEMATGVMPFGGENTKLVLDSILNQVVVPAEHVNPNVPPELHEIIGKCLEKDRDLRYQNASDLREEFCRLKHEMDLVSGRREALALPRLLVLGAAFIILVGVLSFLFRPTALPPRVTGSTQVTHDGRDKERVVTDGSRIYFSSYPNINPRIFQVSAAGGDTIPVDTTILGPYAFDISPDRSELLVGSCYWGRTTSDCPLWILPIGDRAPRRLGNIAASDASWAPDGQQVAYITGNTLYRVKVTGDKPEKIVVMNAGQTLSWPRWSASGRQLRFSVATQSNGTSLWEVWANGRNLHPLLPGWNKPPSECCGSWTPDGRYFLFQSDRGGSANIWVIPEGGNVFRQSSHEPVQLTSGPTSASTVVPSPDGKRLFVTTARSGELMRYDSAAREFAPYLSGMSAIGVDFSRDGKWVTYIAYPEHTLWRSRADGSERLQLTLPPLYALQPRWSPDGKRIAFMAMEGEKPWSIYLVSADGGKAEQPVSGDRLGFDPNWSPDGKRLLFGRHPTTEGPGQGTLDLEIVDLRTHTVSKVAGSEEMWSPRWSRDGRHILAFPRAADRLMLFDVNSQKWSELARIHAGYTEWSHDGKYIYFLLKPKGMPATDVLRIRIEDHKIEHVATLRQFKQPTVDWGDWAGLAPDDSPILLREAGTPEIFALDWDTR